MWPATEAKEYPLGKGGTLPRVPRRMIYPLLDLRLTGLLVALLLILAHGWALLRGRKAQEALLSFPRSSFSGVCLMTAVAIWAFILIATMDLGEFSHLRRILLLLIPIAYALILKFVDEFLAVRAFGMLLLLAAEPVIEAAFLRPETSRLLLVILAYSWAALGIFYVGMPYLLRNQIGWVTSNERRWKVSCLGGIVYGFALLLCAAVFYG
jgi:hypothetical protein